MPVDLRWWEEKDPGVAAVQMLSAASEVDDRNDEVGRYSDSERYLIMWGGKNWAGDGAQLPFERNPQRLNFNIARSAIGTLKAHQGTMRPVTRFLTNEADWKLQRDAKNGEALVNGEFERNKLYKQSPLVYVDAATTGSGAVKVSGSGGFVDLERVLACFELLVDPYETRMAAPMTLYHVRPIDRTVLMSKVQSKTTRELLRTATVAPAGFEAVRRNASALDRACDQIVRVDGYRLPVGDQPGRHIAAVSPGIFLAEETWTRNEFPFAIWHWEERQQGFWGRGLCDMVIDHQRSLNLLDRRIGQMIKRCSQTRVYVGINSQTRARTTDSPVKVIPVGAQNDKITVEAPNVVPTELWNMRSEKVQEAMQEIGINNQAAFAEKSPGVIAAVAIREENQLFNRRALDKAQAFEDWFTEVGRMTLAERVEMAKRGEDEKVRAKRKVAGRQRFFQVKWGDSKLDPDLIEVSTYAASGKPDSPAGRAQVIDEWRQAGALTAQQVMVLTASPDVDEHIETQLAPYNLVLSRIELMMEDGADAYEFPEPDHDLLLISELTTLAINRFEMMGAPDDKLELLRRYKDDARWLLESQQPEPASAGPVVQSNEELAAAQAAAAQQAVTNGAAPAI